MEETIAKDRSAKRRKGIPQGPKKTGIDRAAAERMAADLEGYDSQIQGGRLVGG